jgi:hypothetical protein
MKYELTSENKYQAYYEHPKNTVVPVPVPDR